MTVVGVDPSLRATGLCDGTRAWRVGYSLHDGATLADRGRRIRQVASAATRDVLDAKPVLVVVESPSFGSTGDAVWDLAGLWWCLVGELQYAQVPIALVSPQTRAKYATGNGRSKKRQVKMAVRLRWPQIPVADDNEADAVALAAMGYQHLGRRLATTPVETLDGLAPWMDSCVRAVRWPELRVA